MDAEQLTASLRCFPDVLDAAVAGLVPEQYRFKPTPEAWSVLEVVCHLADEEADDFPLRLRLTLEDPKQDWPPIDPEGWAAERRYNEQDFPAALARFRVSREMNLHWLSGLASPDWDACHEHPLGGLRAGDLLAAWAAHDWLHLRQVTKRRYEWVTQQAEPYHGMYAGEWLA